MIRKTAALALVSPALISLLVAVTTFAACGGKSDDAPVDGAPSTTDGGGDADADADADARHDALSDASGDTAIADASSEIGDAGDAAADSPPETGADGDADAGCLPALTTENVGGACGVVVQSWTDEGHTHVDVGTDVAYCTNPPSSGSHYPIWAAYKTYDQPVRKEYLVHDLEHGAVVIHYRCASGSCPTVQSQITAITDARPVDPTCTAPVQRRIIVVPDPDLDVAIGAAAWGWTYRASCVDPASLNAFLDAHYAHATEDLCADGIDPTATADAGPDAPGG